MTTQGMNLDRILEGRHLQINGGSFMTSGQKAPVVDSSGELSESVLSAMSPDQRERMELLRMEVQQLGKADQSDDRK